MPWVGTDEAPDLAGPGQPRTQAFPGPPPVRPWGLGGPGRQFQHPEPPEGIAFPQQGTPGFCPCQEEGNEEGEQDRDKANEEKPGKRRQELRARRLTLEKEATTCAASLAFNQA